MFELSLPKLVLIALVVLVLFGRGKVADLMGEFGKGVRSFKDGMADETTDRPITPPPSQIAANAAPAPSAGAAAPSAEPVQPADRQG